MTDDQFFAKLVDFPKQGIRDAREARTVWKLQVSDLLGPTAEGTPILYLGTQNALEKIIHDGSVKTYRVLMRIYRRFASTVKSEARVIVESVIQVVVADAQHAWKECVDNSRVEYWKGKYVDGSERVYRDPVLLIWGALRTAAVGDVIKLQARKLVADEPRTSAQILQTRAARPPRETRPAKKATRQNLRYEKIDSALKLIAKTFPLTHKEVFQNLDAREVPWPTAAPFSTWRGWVAGFNKDAPGARAWLSKRWSQLNLPRFLRGPKKASK